MEGFAQFLLRVIFKTSVQCITMSAIAKFWIGFGRILRILAYAELEKDQLPIDSRFGPTSGSWRAARGGRLPSRVHDVSLRLGLHERSDTISHLSRQWCTRSSIRRPRRRSRRLGCTAVSVAPPGLASDDKNRLCDPVSRPLRRPGLSRTIRRSTSRLAPNAKQNQETKLPQGIPSCFCVWRSAQRKLPSLRAINLSRQTGIWLSDNFESSAKGKRGSNNEPGANIF